MDLEKFFDRVQHCRLMYRLATGIEDKRLLRLILKYVQAGILLKGLRGRSTEGTSQGGPLSPLLPNIVVEKVSWFQHLSFQGEGENQGSSEKLETTEAKAEGNDQHKLRDGHERQDCQAESSYRRLGELLLSGNDESDVV